MRIDDRQLTENQAAQSGKAAQAQSIARQQETKPGGPNSLGGSDQVQLSGLLEGLSRALEAADAERSAKVERLEGEYQSGNYRVDSQAVSRAVLAEALASSGATGR